VKLLKIYFLFRVCWIALVIGLYATLIHLLIETISADPLDGLAKIHEAETAPTKPPQATQAVAKLNP
jgi:hypothetical protein